MKSLYFKGYAAEVTVVNVDEEEFDSIQNEEVDSYEVRDEMNAIHPLYNILVEEGTFLDENDNEVEVNFIPLYCSNIGEPIENLYPLSFDELAEGFLADVDIEEWDEIQTKLINAKQFVKNEDDEIVLSDPDIKKTMQNMMCVDDLEGIETLVSVVSIEKGYWEIEIPEGFDLNKPIAIGTYEIEYSGQQIGAIIMQYNNEKLLLETLINDVDTSQTKSTVILTMTDIEYNEGRLMSDELDEIG